MHEPTHSPASGIKPAIGMRGLAYHYDELVPIDSLPRMVSNPEMLKNFKQAGFESVAVSHVSITQQAILSARKTLSGSGLTAADIDAVVIGTSELRDWKTYPEVAGTEILLGLGLKDILVVGVTIAGCANYGSSLRVARNMIAVDGYRNVLVIETNQVRGDMDRVFSPTGKAGFVVGDGAVSFIATAGQGDFKVLGMEQIVKPLDYAVTNSAAFAANNVSGFRHVVERALAQARVKRGQVEKVFFHNIRAAALNGFFSVLDLARYKLFADNIAKTGHVWGGDNLIGLVDYCAAENPQAGAIFLMLCQADFYYSAVVCQKQ
jgi:3-oxoacyl-[acyl-carrier-protein] synthase-3